MPILKPFIEYLCLRIAIYSQSKKTCNMEKKEIYLFNFKLQFRLDFYFMSFGGLVRLMNNYCVKDCCNFALHFRKLTLDDINYSAATR